MEVITSLLTWKMAFLLWHFAVACITILCYELVLHASKHHWIKKSCDATKAFLLHLLEGAQKALKPSATKKSKK